MLSVSEKNKLYDLLKDFYTAIGIRIAIFDNDFNKITEYPEKHPPICAIIRSTAEGLSACKKCDQAAFVRAKNKQAPHTYICHAGLTEAITPITSNGILVGYAIFAHLIPKENYDATIEEICRRCKTYCNDAVALRTAVKKQKAYSSQKISAAMRLLETITAFLATPTVINWKNNDIVYHLNQFIEQNLAMSLTSDYLCSQFYISRTKLYQISIKAFGMSIAQYITFKRIEKAKELLLDASLSVAKVGVKVGVSDYNYFCKLFRKETGITPKQYRNEYNR